MLDFQSFIFGYRFESVESAYKQSFQFKRSTSFEESKGCLTLYTKFERLCDEFILCELTTVSVRDPSSKGAWSLYSYDHFFSALPFNLSEMINEKGLIKDLKLPLDASFTSNVFSKEKLEGKLVFLVKADRKNHTRVFRISCVPIDAADHQPSFTGDWEALDIDGRYEAIAFHDLASYSDAQELMSELLKMLRNESSKLGKINSFHNKHWPRDSQ